VSAAGMPQQANQGLIDQQQRRWSRRSLPAVAMSPPDKLLNRLEDIRGMWRPCPSDDQPTSVFPDVGGVFSTRGVVVVELAGVAWHDERFCVGR
jgi:hypothetical protein